jgi:hypothetical protein
VSLATIRTSIAAKIAAVVGIAGVAPVHEYLRHATMADELKTLLVGANQERLHFWCVTPAQGNPLTIVQRMGCQDGIYRWEVHGFYALEDAVASEKTFLNIVEKVLDALRADLTLGNTVRPVEGAWPGWAENDHRMMASVLCHHVRLTTSYKQQLT